MDLQGYMQAFRQAERDFEEAVEEFGLPFEAGESSPRARRGQVAHACGCHCENGGASLWRNWISPACLACRTGEETATFFVDLRCTKNCYFCFNPNQDHYEYFLSHQRDIVAELEQAYAAGARFRCLAITGGEPLLHFEQVKAFLARAAQLYPQAHTRLYTCGDALDASRLAELTEAGLQEIRFSIKPLEVDASQEAVYRLMEQAATVVPAVMVEVPVIPGSCAWMEDLLLRCEAVGVRGVNLLEFCFPLHNAQEFAHRGFALRRRPYNYLYNYWYGGGIPVAGSEAEALQLLEFAECKGLRLGIHYCSSDNKNTGQVYQQNKAFLGDEGLRRQYPWLTEDEGDRFLKCAKAFGEDANTARAWAEGAGVPCGYDPEIPNAALPVNCVQALLAAHPQIKLAESANIIEECEPNAGNLTPTLYLREVAANPLNPMGPII